MDSRRGALREQVEKWMSFESAQLVRVTRLVRGTRKLWRCVYVEAERAAGTFSLVLFRHEDGSWRVYPPENPRPYMAVAGVMPLVFAEHRKMHGELHVL